MEQKSVQIGKIEVPIIIDGGEEWFPVSFITTKVLLRSGKGSLVNKGNKDKISEYLKNYVITYGESNVQESKCISGIGLIGLLNNTQIGRLSASQRLAQNQLHKYLGICLLPTEEQDSKKYKKEWLVDLDDYTKDVVKITIESDNVEWFRMCSKCNKHYPLTSNFFSSDNRVDKGFGKVCRVCLGINEYFTHHDSHRSQIKRLLDADKIMDIYFDYKDSHSIKTLPPCYENKESYLRIIEGLYESNMLNEKNITQTYLVSECKLKNVTKYLNTCEIYSYLFGEDFYYYAWKYPKFQFKEIELTYDIAKRIVKNYIHENDIVINDIFDYDYETLFKNCGIKQICRNDILLMIVQFYDYQYPAYVFKIRGVNYYKKEESLLFDLKYLIEVDMKLDVNKIPLYLTKSLLQKKCISLYYFIVTNKNGSLFDWVNKLYPDKFVESDFDITAYRDEFGSNAEKLIDEVLRSIFKNVIYNQIHTSRTIKINGMIPDWFILDDDGVYIVEYFGLFDEKQYGKTEKITSYIDKAKNKIERYKNVTGYKFIFLYPNDIEDDFEGCREVIEKIKENPYTSIV